jgi:glycosyltransferase involved in cell wall biosynthesis
VLIPCYQSADTVGDAVASVLGQTHPAHEVIVCDDGSTDDPARALGSYAGKFTLLRKANGGGASALNHAVAAATAEFVAILDADDVYDPRRLEALAQLGAVRPDLDILSTDSWLERGGKIVGRYSDADPFAVEDQRAAILRTCFPGGWPAVRRERVLAAGGWDESFAIAYDWECWLRLIHAGAVVGMVAEPLMTYRLRPGSLSADPVQSLRERIRMLRAIDAAHLSRHERAVRRATLGRDRRRLAAEEIAAAVKSHAPRAALLRLAARRRAPVRSRLAAVRASARKEL